MELMNGHPFQKKDGSAYKATIQHVEPPLTTCWKRLNITTKSVIIIAVSLIALSFIFMAIKTKNDIPKLLAATEYQTRG